MKYRAEFTGNAEMTWSRNALTFDTAEAATQYAHDLLGRWTGADMARVVEDVTPDREPVSYSDPRIVATFRKVGS
jgi:hypothetical protein